MKILSVVLAIVPIAVIALFVHSVYGLNEFLTYENPDYNIRMVYPGTWNKSEINLIPYQVAFFYPPDLIRSKSLFERLLDFKPNVPPVTFVIEVLPRTSTNMSESAFRYVSSFEKDNQSRLIDHNRTTLSGIDAYETIYYDYRNDETRKALRVWTIHGNDSFSLLYHTEPGYSDQYLPYANRMIESFEITNGDSNNSNSIRGIRNEVN